MLAIDLSERVLGAQGERRYFIAFENLAEMRGAGGLWGNCGVLMMAENNLRDVPDVGPVDGVIAIDAHGLAALLRITGPVTVPSWPEPIDASDVARVMLPEYRVDVPWGRPDREGLVEEVLAAVGTRALSASERPGGCHT